MVLFNTICSIPHIYSKCKYIMKNVENEKITYFSDEVI